MYVCLFSGIRFIDILLYAYVNSKLSFSISFLKLVKNQFSCAISPFPNDSFMMI